MGSLYEFIDAIADLKREIRDTGAAASAASDEIKRASASSSRVTDQGGSPSPQIGAESLGDTRDAEAFGARLYQSIEAAKRR